jgi:hypothetical protein
MEGTTSYIVTSVSTWYRMLTSKRASAKALPLSTAWLPTKADADIANVLTIDEAQRVASNIAKLPDRAPSRTRILPMRLLKRERTFRPFTCLLSRG